MDDFHQEPPRLGNQFEDDALLRSYLRRALPAPMHAEVEPELARLGDRVAGDILALGEAAEAAPPRHVPYDPWGRRVDRIETSEAWRALASVSASEGLVALGYERAHGALSRVDQFARLYLFSPSSAIYSCPLAMSDGAARCLELFGGADERLRCAFRHLTTRDPEQFWTSGQWMTERAGGSDVGRTATIATRDGDAFRLTGTKWFTSATTSQMAMTLARIQGAASGSRGLSLFYLELRDPAGALRDLRILRLKDKLGTRALPTAELSLDGTPAWLVGGEGDGVRRIATLFNITRVYNAVAAVGGMRRAIALARDYARRRVAFGKPLAEHPLHVETLADMEVELHGAFHLAFHVVELLGKSEVGEASDAERTLLRLLTPVAKLYTGKQAVAVASEALEAFGGAGYIEDTGLPRLLRDAQVLSIWEGTTNVLSLDLLRALDSGADLGVLVADIDARLARVSVPALGAAVRRVRAAAHALREAAGTETIARGAGRGGVAADRSADAPAVGDGGEERAAREAGARAFAYAVARSYAGALLLEHAAWSIEHERSWRAAVAATRWCARDLALVASRDAGHRAGSRALALDLPLGAAPG